MAASVVVANSDGVYSEKSLIAYLVLNSNAEQPTGGELRAYLQEKLPDYMVPSQFVALPEFPLTANGKVDRKTLTATEKKRSDLSETFLAPRDVLERQLASIWEEILKTHPIGVRDNFFELGGNSLSGVRVVAQVLSDVGQETASGSAIPKCNY